MQPQCCSSLTDQALLKQRLQALFISRPGRRVSLRDLLRMVPDLEERKTWTFRFALYRVLGDLQSNTPEYREGMAYYWNYGLYKQ
jgi:hypothetical protein